MDDMIYTLQDFMLHTENNTYVILAIYLICVVVFWQFLTRKDKDEDNNNSDMCRERTKTLNER